RSVRGEEQPAGRSVASSVHPDKRIVRRGQTPMPGPAVKIVRNPMSRRLFVAVAVLAAAWITVRGQSLPGAPTKAPVSRPAPPPPSAPGVIIGQVVDAASGRGVARAAVHLSGRAVDQFQVADDRGRFYFLDIPEGNVEIAATKIGFFDGAFGKRR